MESNSSLLQMFQSPYFSIQLQIYYLHQTLAEKKHGYHDFLANKIYGFNEKDVDFFLPEICYLIINYNSSVHRYLLDRSSNDISFYLRSSWLLEAFVSCAKINKNKDSKKLKFITLLLESLENCMVNAECHLINQPPIPKNISTQTPEKLFAESLMKNIRNELKDVIKKFVISLVNDCYTLKKEPIENRKNCIKTLMLQTNTWLWHKKMKKLPYQDIPDEAIQNYCKILKEGILFPFQKSKKKTINSNMIVRIIYDESICFNTNTRVPYKVVFETIDFRDLQKFSPEYTNDDDYDFMCENLNHNTSREILPFDMEMYKKEQMLDETKNEIQEKNNKYKNLEAYAKWKKEEEQKQQSTTPQKKWSFASMKEKIDLALSPKKKLNIFSDYKLFQKKSSLKNDSHCGPYLRRSSSRFKQLLKKKSHSVGVDRLVKHKPGKETHKVLKRHRRMSFIEQNSLEFIESHIHFIREKIISTQLKGANEEKTFQIRAYYASLFEKRNIKKKEKELKYNLGELIKNFREEKISLGPWDILWEKKVAKICERSPYAKFPSYQLRQCIVKGGDDLRQEMLIMKLITRFQEIFEESSISLCLRPYEIIVTSKNSGVIEFIPDSISLDGLKKKYPGKSLRIIYEEIFIDNFEEAQKNFIESLAAYSIVSYLLSIKDRHNGNILIDATGKVIHIDFGYTLGASPGGINFESAPFKLTKEYVEMMDGTNSHLFEYFKILIISGFSVLKKYVEEFVTILKIMMENSELLCFQKFNLQSFKDRFGISFTDKDLNEYVNKLVLASCENKFTAWYDEFQKYTVGYEIQPFGHYIISQQ